MRRLVDTFERLFRVKIHRKLAELGGMLRTIRHKVGSLLSIRNARFSALLSFFIWKIYMSWAVCPVYNNFKSVSCIALVLFAVRVSIRVLKVLATFRSLFIVDYCILVHANGPAVTHA